MNMPDRFGRYTARRSIRSARRGAPHGSRRPRSPNGAKPSHTPVGWNLVVFVEPALPLAVAPIELAAGPVRGGGFELFFRNIELVGFERGVVAQRIPRQRVIFLAHAEETAESHHRVGDFAAHLVDHHPLDLAHLLA